MTRTHYNKLFRRTNPHTKVHLTERIGLDFVGKKRFVSKQFVTVGVIVNAQRPVVRDHDIDGLFELRKTKDLEIPHMVHTVNTVVIVRRHFPMTFIKVV